MSMILWRRCFWPVIAAALAIASPTAAVTFKGTFAAFSGDPLAANFDPPTGGFDFGDIDVGRGSTIAPLRIYTDETDFNALLPEKKFFVAFRFETDPVFTPAWEGIVGGAADGTTEYGYVRSNGSVSQTVAGIGTVVLDLLPDAPMVRFNQGNGGLMPGLANGSELKFLLSYLSLEDGPAVIPLPATLPLTLAGLVALGFLARRRASHLGPNLPGRHGRILGCSQG